MSSVQSQLSADLGIGLAVGLLLVPAGEFSFRGCLAIVDRDDAGHLVS